MSAKLFLLDAHALCYRSFYAIRELTNSRGQPTNAIYGFVSTLRKLMRDFKPDYMAVCFDSAKKTHREAKFAEYKIQRPSMPDPLVSQIPLIKDVIRAYNLKILEEEGYEADDLIATMTEQFKDNDLEIVIVSDDKDMLQLAANNVKFFQSRKDMILNFDDVKELLGFEPRHITDFISLAGDSVDNIPGVKGIGQVTAKDLIKQFGTLENILSNVDKIKSAKLQEKLQNDKDTAVLCKNLALLETKVPVKINLNDLKVTGPDKEKLLELFKEFEFKKFCEDLSIQDQKPAESKIKINHLQQDPPIDFLIKVIKRYNEFGLMVEPHIENDLLSCSNIFISFGQDKDVFTMSYSKIEKLKDVLEDPSILKVVYNLKETLKTLNQRGQEFHLPNTFDTMLAGYLLGVPQVSDFSDLIWNYFRVTLSESNKLAQQSAYLRDLHKILHKELEEKSLSKLMDEIETPLSYVLFRMEQQGVTIDCDLLSRLSKECDIKIQDLTSRLYKAAGGEFNLNSPKQLSQVLFEKLKLPVIKKTKTGFSTDEGVLNTLAKQHDAPALILEYRQLAKLKSTYIDALPVLVNAHTKRIHTYFDQIGAETGRLSSRQPNLQNIPIRTELGRQIRKAIIASKDNILIAADYSQIELRILAHLTQDENLLKAFQKDDDIHRYTASLVFEVDEKDVTPQMRDSAKRVNFGIIYGMSAFGLAKDLGISNSEAQDFIDRYFLRYPKVKKYMDESIAQCEADGYVTTLLQRRRYIPGIVSKDMMLRQFGQRQAINTPVQGSAADLMKLAMINVQQEIEKKNLKTKMIMTVHDELVFDGPESEKEAMIKVIRQHMEQGFELSVPIKVTIKVGKNWLEMKDI